MTYGPAKPDRLPIELIAAISAAAEVPVRKALGIGHIRGGVAETPIWPRQSKPSTRTGAETSPAPPTPMAARIMAGPVAKFGSGRERAWTESGLPKGTQ